MTGSTFGSAVTCYRFYGVAGLWKNQFEVELRPQKRQQPAATVGAPTFATVLLASRNTGHYTRAETGSHSRLMGSCGEETSLERSGGAVFWCPLAKLTAAYSRCYEMVARLRLQQVLPESRSTCCAPGGVPCCYFK